MKYALPLALYLLSVLGLWWTDDLYQDNDERQLIAAQHAYSQEEQALALHFTGLDPKPEQLEEVLDGSGIDYQIYGPQELTGKESTLEQLKFYQQYPHFFLKARTETTSTFLIFLSPEQKRLFPSLIETLLQTYPENTLQMAGLPYLNYAITQKTKDIKTLILPLLIVFSLLLSLIFIRNFYQAAVMFSFPLAAIAVTQFLLKVIYGQSNLLSTLSPLVNFVIVLSLSYHLYFGWCTYQETKVLMRKKLKPILFMITTTVIGILSLSTSDIHAIQSFSLSTALSIIISTLITILIFNRLSSYFHCESFPASFSMPQLKINKIISWALLILPLGLLTQITNLPTQVEALYFFPGSEKVVQDHQYLQEHVLQQPLLKIKLPQYSVAKDYQKISSLVPLENKLSQALDGKARVLSPISFLKDINLVYAQKRELPELQNSALTLLSRAPSELWGGVETYQITLLGKTPESDEYQKMIQEVKELLAQSGVRYQLSGTYYQLMNSQSNLIGTLLKSFGLSLLTISLMIGLMFKNIKRLMVFLLVNLAPPILTLASFKFFNLSLNLATVMTFSISFGLIVDSTIHIMYAKGHESDPQRFYNATMHPILVSSLVLIVGFAIFSFHSFLPIWQFGLSLAITLLYGFFYDYYVLAELEESF